MTAICRWHIKRVYSVEKSAEQEITYAEVSIAQQQVDILAATNLASVKDLPTIKEDNLEWWDPDEDNHLEGYAYEEMLIYGLSQRNLVQANVDADETVKKRKIEEDMVFLELYEPTSNFLDIYRDLMSKKGLPNVNALIETEHTQWLDFTQQARTMSANLYRQVLGK